MKITKLSQQQKAIIQLRLQETMERDVFRFMELVLLELGTLASGDGEERNKIINAASESFDKMRPHFEELTIAVRIGLIMLLFGEIMIDFEMCVNETEP